jgi:hypothetical protein
MFFALVRRQTTALTAPKLAHRDLGIVRVKQVRAALAQVRKQRRFFVDDGPQTSVSKSPGVCPLE